MLVDSEKGIVVWASSIASMYAFQLHNAAKQMGLWFVYDLMINKLIILFGTESLIFHWIHDCEILDTRGGRDCPEYAQDRDVFLSYIQRTW